MAATCSRMFTTLKNRCTKGIQKSNKRKRGQTSNSLVSSQSFSDGKRPDERIFSRFVWAELKGTKAKWPVKVTERKEDDITVYIRCDNIHQHIKPADTFPFHENLSKMKEEGLVALKKMPETLKCFKLDVQWAQEEHEIDSTKMNESEGESETCITKEDGKDMKRNGDKPEYESNSNKVVVKEGESDKKQEEERNMNVDKTENEMNTNNAVQSNRESDKGNEEERNINMNVDKSENELDTNNAVESDRESDISKEEGRKTNMNSDTSEYEIDSNKVVVKKRELDKKRDEERDINMKVDKSINEIDSKKVVESDGESDTRKKEGRNMNRLSEKSENQMDLNKVVGSGESYIITKEDGRKMNMNSDNSEYKIDSNKVVVKERELNKKQEEDRNMNMNEMDKNNAVESEREPYITKEEGRKMNMNSDTSENEIDSNQVVVKNRELDKKCDEKQDKNMNVDKTENEMDTNNAVESDGESDKGKDEERNMNMDIDKTENEMDTCNAVESDGESDIRKDAERNINMNVDKSENEINPNKTVESDGESDISKEEGRKMNMNSDTSDCEIDSDKVVVKEREFDKKQEEDRNMNMNEMDKNNAVESEREPYITKEEGRKMNMNSDTSENEIDSNQVVVKNRELDKKCDEKQDKNMNVDKTENEMDTNNAVESDGESDKGKDEERNMNMDIDKTENEMDTCNAVEIDGESDIKKDAERNINMNVDKSENEINPNKTVESDGESDISKEEGRKMNMNSDTSDCEIDSDKVVVKEREFDKKQEEDRNMNMNEMDKNNAVESEREPYITKEEGRKMNMNSDTSENEIDSNQVVVKNRELDKKCDEKQDKNMNVDKTENEMDKNNAVESDGESDKGKDEERNMNMDIDKTENEMDTCNAVESDGESDIRKDAERNINMNVDKSENEINPNKTVESDGESDISKEEGRKMNMNSDTSDCEIDSDKVVVKKRELDKKRDKKRDNMKVDKSVNEIDSIEVVESERESDTTKKDGGNMDRNSKKSKNEMDSNKVLDSDEESDVVEESENNEEGSSIIHFSLSKKNILGKKKAGLKESKIDRDINFPGIYIRKILKSFTSSRAQRARKVAINDRVYNSYHACFFCGELKSHVKTHIDTHAEDSKAAEYIGESGKFEPSMKTKLFKEGDHKHNCKVIQNELGEIILARRPTKSLDVSKFGPCPECHEWILLKNIRVHHVKCTEKSKKPRISKRRLIIQSQVLGGFISGKPSKMMIEEVFPSITRDEIGSVAKADPLIIALGEKWLRKSIDNREKRKNYTSGHMRLMARLLIELRKHDRGPDTNTKELSHYLRSANFDLLLHAAIQCCTPYMDDIEDLRAPSNGIKLKYDVERIISLRWAMLVKEDPHSILAKEMDVLQRLLSLDWADRITKLARSVLVRRQISLTKHLPSPQDVECLTKHMRKQLKEIQLTSCNFFRIVQLTETRLLMYNKRRSGEIESLSVASYARRTADLDDMDESLIDDLTKVERHLLKTQELMKVRGKRSRPVPVIIPEDTKKALAFISNSDVRGNVGIPSSNTYLFPNSAGSYARAYDALKRTSEECDLRNPSRITSVSMRKYTATLTQLLNLPKHEVEWLCKHLGHSADIHKTFYQQMSGLVERVYVSKLFLVQDFNLSSKYKHKSLKDVDLEEIVFSEQVENDVEQEESEDILQASSIEESELPADPCVFQDLGSSGEEDNTVIGDEDFETSASTSVGRKVKKHFKRTRWSQKEEDELKKYFGEYLDSKICPRRKEVDKIKNLSKKKGGDIWRRSNDKIIKKISNMNHQ